MAGALPRHHCALLLLWLLACLDCFVWYAYLSAEYSLCVCVQEFKASSLQGAQEELDAMQEFFKIKDAKVTVA